MSRVRRVTIAAMLCALAACGSSNDLDEEGRATLGSAIVAAAEGAGLVLPTVGVECFAERLPDEIVGSVVAATGPEWDAETGQAVAGQLVECVGAEELMAADLRALRPDLSVDSVTCVSQRLDDEVVQQVIDAALRERPRNGPAVEVELSVALGICLSPEELLDL